MRRDELFRMKQIRPNTVNAKRRGAATVEFALVLPVLLLLMFGSMEFARANQVANAAAFSAYQGCRQAIIPGGTVASATTAAKQVLNAQSISPSNIAVSPSVIDDTTTTVTILVSVNMNTVGWISPMFMKNKTITRGCTLTRETTNQNSAEYQAALAAPPPAPVPPPPPPPTDTSTTSSTSSSSTTSSEVPPATQSPSQAGASQ